MHDVFVVAAAFAASAVEMVEALTIVLAVGVTRGWRSAGWGVARVFSIVALAGTIASIFASRRSTFSAVVFSSTASPSVAVKKLWAFFPS